MSEGFGLKVVLFICMFGSVIILVRFFQYFFLEFFQQVLLEPMVSSN